MSVVINEFEVVPAQQQEQAGPPPPPPPKPTSGEVDDEIERVVRRQHAREHRLRAT
jgi:hypothetical protein